MTAWKAAHMPTDDIALEEKIVKIWDIDGCWLPISEKPCEKWVLAKTLASKHKWKEIQFIKLVSAYS